MHWLIRKDTRGARVTILRLRLRTLRFGDDFAETYLALDACIYAIVCLLPGDTTGASRSFRDIAALLHGDLGVGIVFAVLAVGLTLAALRLVSDATRLAVFVAAFAIWVGMAVGFFISYPASLGPYIAVLNAFAAWIAYLRSDL